MGLAEVKADIALVREQIVNIKDASKWDAKRELTENVLPLLTGFVEATQAALDELAEEVNDQGEALDELIDNSGDVLHPETAAKILGLIEIGKALAKELEQLLPKLDDLGKKRVRELIKTYRQGAIVVGEEIAEITIPLDDIKDGEPGEEATEPGDDDDGDADDQGDEGDEIAAKEQK